VPSGRQGSSAWIATTVLQLTYFHHNYRPFALRTSQASAASDRPPAVTAPADITQR